MNDMSRAYVLYDYFLSWEGGFSSGSKWASAAGWCSSSLTWGRSRNLGRGPSILRACTLSTVWSAGNLANSSIHDSQLGTLCREKLFLIFTKKTAEKQQERIKSSFSGFQVTEAVKKPLLYQIWWIVAAIFRLQASSRLIENAENAENLNIRGIWVT